MIIILFELIIGILRNNETNSKLSPRLQQIIVKGCFCNYHIKYLYHNFQSPNTHKKVVAAKRGSRKFCIIASD